MQNIEKVNFLNNLNSVDSVNKSNLINKNNKNVDFKAELSEQIFKDNTNYKISYINNETYINENKTESTESLKFSKHAIGRIISRGISLTDSQLTSLNEALLKASNKGIKDSLVMLNDTAFIVNVRNKTVITAINKENIRDKIITNIDGVVIL